MESLSFFLSSLFSFSLIPIDLQETREVDINFLKWKMPPFGLGHKNMDTDLSYSLFPSTEKQFFGFKGWGRIFLDVVSCDYG